MFWISASKPGLISFRMTGHVTGLLQPSMQHLNLHGIQILFNVIKVKLKHGRRWITILPRNQDYPVEEILLRHIGKMVT